MVNINPSSSNNFGNIDRNQSTALPRPILSNSKPEIGAILSGRSNPSNGINRIDNLNPEIIASKPKKASEAEVINVYNAALKKLDERGARAGLLGNFLKNTGIDNNKMRCYEQAEFMVKSIMDQFADDPSVNARTVTLTAGAFGGGEHTVVRMQIGNKTYWADPWKGIPPTQDEKAVIQGETRKD